MGISQSAHERLCSPLGAPMPVARPESVPLSSSKREFNGPGVNLRSEGASCRRVIRQQTGLKGCDGGPWEPTAVCRGINSLARKLLHIDLQMAIKGRHHNANEVDHAIDRVIEVGKLELRSPTGHVQHGRLS